MRNKDILLQVLRVFIGEAVCTAIMILFYFLLHKLDASVLLGALAGSILAIGNFFFLSLSVAKAADRTTSGGEAAAAKAKVSIQRSSTMRMLVLLALYFLLLKTGYFSPLAAVLPLLFTQVSIYVTEFFRKDGDKSK